MKKWLQISQRRTGLRERFALAMGLFVISTGLAVTMLVEWRLASALQKSARDNLQRLANQIAHDIGDDVGRRRREIARLADVLGGVDVIHSDTAQRVLDGLRSRQPAYAWIGLTGDKGQVLAASDRLLLGVDVSSRPWFAGGKGGDYFGDAHDAKLLAAHLAPGKDGEPPRFFDIASPVRNVTGRWEGVLGAHLYTEWVHKVVEGAIASRTEDFPIEIFVADGKGDWLLSPHVNAAVNLPRLLIESTEETHLLAKAKARVDERTYGVEWSVVVRESVEDAFAPVYENRRQMLIITPLAAVLLAITTWFVAGRVVQPVARLADSARRHIASAGYTMDEGATPVRDEASQLGQALIRLALKDPLTGLGNRSALKQLLQALQSGQESAAANPEPYAVLLLNLDDFHFFNNTRGHEAGDLLLRAVAMRLLQLCEPGVFPARLGGDEFVVVMKKLSRADAVQQAESFARRVLDAFGAPFEVAGSVCRCEVSIGVVVVDAPVVSSDVALTNAEVAMQEAKRLGKNRIAMFDNYLQERLIEQVQFEQELEAAIPSQLLVLYQPQVNRERKLIGAELLVRWNHPKLGSVSPARFIPVAEQTGLIVPIGYWVLEQACRQLAVWQKTTDLRTLSLAVNVSAHEFSQSDYVGRVQQVLDRTGADPTRLKIELTESALAVDADEVVSKMVALRKMGIAFALDDFGTGFSSLSYLKRMPINQLKIDQSFVRELLTDNSSTSIVRTIVALGAGLGLEIIAEGVETEEQRQRLADLGCFNYQGYLFGRPKPVEDLFR